MSNAADKFTGDEYITYDAEHRYPYGFLKVRSMLLCHRACLVSPSELAVDPPAGGRVVVDVTCVCMQGSLCYSPETARHPKGNF